MKYTTHYERVEAMRKYDALHRLISDAIEIAPVAERSWLREYESDLLDRWQEAASGKLEKAA